MRISDEDWVKKSIELKSEDRLEDQQVHGYVVCQSQVRHQVSEGSRCRGSLMHELISVDSAIDHQVTSQSGVCCKRTSVSHLVVKLHSLYRCRLVL